MWILILSADARILCSGLQVCCERGRWSLRVRGNVPQCGLPGSLLLLHERGDFSRGHRVRIAAELREPAPDIRIADHLGEVRAHRAMIESGVPIGATTTCQPAAANPGMVSVTVGSSANSGRR